jgi:hypothetical protein
MSQNREHAGMGTRGDAGYGFYGGEMGAARYFVNRG